jgi:hypothetical protein
MHGSTKPVSDPDRFHVRKLCNCESLREGASEISVLGKFASLTHITDYLSLVLPLSLELH